MRREVVKVLQESKFLEAFVNGGNVEILTGHNGWVGRDNPDFAASAKYRVSTPEKVDPIDYETACQTIVAKSSVLAFESVGSEYIVMGIRKAGYNSFTLLVETRGGTRCEIYAHSLTSYTCKDFPLLVRTPQYIEVDLTNV